MTTSPETFSASDPDAGIRVAALYEAHGRTIVGLCRFLLRDATEAEDAAQQSFLSAYRSLLGGAVPREPAAWLAAIARNECWLRIKRRMREPLALHEVPCPQADPLEAAARNADFATLRAGLEALSQPQREAFMLREFAGLSYSELALALGVTEPAVDSLLFRARTSLRRALSAANGILVPVALRDQLARLIPGFDQPAVGTLAKLASLPIAAKVAAAGAGAMLVVAGSTGLGRHPPVTTDVAAPVPARIRTARIRLAPIRIAPIRTAPGQSSASTPRLLLLPHSARVASLRRALRVSESPALQATRRGLGTDIGAPSSISNEQTPADTDPDPVPAPPATGDVGNAPTSGGAGDALPNDGIPADTPTDGTAVVSIDPGSDDDPVSDDLDSGSSGSGSSGSGSSGSGSSGLGRLGSDDSSSEPPEPPEPSEAPKASTTPGD